MQKSLIAVLNHARTRAWLTTGYFVPDGVTLAALELCAAGVRIFEFSSAINHTKAGVIDKDWLLVGSANIDNRSMRVNFELSVLVRHPGAAAEFAGVLTEDFSNRVESTAETFAKRPWREKALEAAARPFAPLL